MITVAGPNDFKTIQQIAHRTWPATYGSILSEAQLQYMLDAFYSDTTLLQNYTEKNHQFLIFREDAIALGFVSFEHQYEGNLATRIHKLYVLPNTQGQGIGRQLLDAVVPIAAANRSKLLSLNVNRFNKAKDFYLRYGFEIVKEEDIDIGEGYLMEDYVMEFPL